MTRLPPLNAMRSFRGRGTPSQLHQGGRGAFRHPGGDQPSDQGAWSRNWECQAVPPAEPRLDLTDEGQALLALCQKRLRSADNWACGHWRTSAPAAACASRRRRHLQGIGWSARLGRLRLAHPEIEIQLSANERLVDFMRDGIDCAISHGDGDWPDLGGSPVSGEDRPRLQPHCLLREASRFETPADLASYTSACPRRLRRMAGLAKRGRRRPTSISTRPVVSTTAILP